MSNMSINERIYTKNIYKICTNITKHVHEYNSLYLCILHVFAYMCLYMHVLEIHKEAQCMYLYVSVCIYLCMSVYD
jgi:hypothetical protein